MRKKAAVLFLFLIVIAGFINNYAYKCVVDAFHIDASKKITEATAPELLNTVQNNNFRLVNRSGKTVKLHDIQLEDYQGIKIGSLSWSTNSQGIIVSYDVQISEPVIQNPKKVIVKYSYFGIMHTQVLEMP